MNKVLRRQNGAFFYFCIMKENILSAEGIHKSYRNKLGKITPVLKGLTADVVKGEMLAVMGPSGAGKSTLLNILGSLDHPDKGSVKIFIDGKSFEYGNFGNEDIARFRNRHIGFVFQFHHLLPEFSALENVMMPGLIAGDSYAELRDKSMLLLKRVGVDDRAGNKPMELSGGEQQRVAIARALTNDPSIVLADEPTGNLDKENSNAVIGLLNDLMEELGITFVIATHSNDVAGHAARILTIGDGIIAREVENRH